MKKLVFALFLGFLANIQAQNPRDNQQQLIAAEMHRHEMLQDFQSTLAGDNIDIKYHAFRWSIDPAQRYIAGSVQTKFVATTPLSILTFDCDTALRVSRVVFRGQNLSFQQLSSNILEISLPQSIAAGTYDSITVHYAGTPPQTGFGSFMQRLRNGVPELWTLSEPYGSRDWFPCKMDLKDKIDSIDVYVTTNMQYQVASNGILKGVYPDSPIPELRTHHWQHRYPIANYLIAIAVTRYDTNTTQIRLPSGGNMPLVNYAYPEDTATARARMPLFIRTLQLYDSLFGAYPFKKEKYGHAQFGWGGGMEHQTMSFVTHFGNDLAAHEVAHQWFGDKITCGSWEDIWLNEGFATYATGLYYEKLDAQWWRAWRESTLSSATSSTSGSVWVNDTTSVGRIFSGALTYNKGAYLLRMLQYKLGDSAFFMGIRNYLSDPNLAYSFARVTDLKRHLTLSSGQNLDEFFRDWFYGKGYPTYNYWACNTINGTTFTIQQLQSDPSVFFFEMPFEVKFINRSLNRDTVLRFTPVYNAASTFQTFDVRLNFAPDSVAFDPELWLCAKVNTRNKIIGTCLSTNEQNAVAKLSVYPNPAKDRVNIAFLNENNAFFANVKIFDLLGREILEKKYDICSGENSLILPLATFQKGIYLLETTVGNQKSVQKIVIE